LTDHVTGGTSCGASLITNLVVAQSPAATDARTLWFGGQYVYATAFGAAEFPVDPRSFTDPNHPIWP
jgi:hypothetical protein